MSHSLDFHSSGLRTWDIDFIRTVFAWYPSISRVRIFGSRAKGDWTQRSDVDLAYEGEISHHDYAQIWSRLSYDAPYLYQTDLIDYDRAPYDLQSHIDRVGVTV